MDLQITDYLEAIQKIPGNKPGEKYRELNSIAKKAIDEAKCDGAVAISVKSVDGVPEPLKPLVRLKIGQILQQNEAVVEALKSEDGEISSLALRTKWFLQADNNEVINVEYFKTNLYPSMTLNTRLKMIKRLTRSLRASVNTALAEEFYNFTSETYGKIQATPLLAACSESFIWTAITEQKIVLSCRMLMNLFDIYPELVIRYLNLSKPVDTFGRKRNVHDIDIHKYTFFLPRLINNHLKSLIELIQEHRSSLGIKLSNKATERFLKGNVEVVLNSPDLYKNMMPLKVIAAKVTESQYKRMLVNVFPRDRKNFDYSYVEEYFKHYPKEERLPLLLETYSKVYHSNMLDNHDIIDAKILKMLPVHQRIRQARIKLQKEPGWHKENAIIEETWRCYFPLEETITAIKQDISNSSLAEKRSKLLQQMFFVCSINDDKEALLQALTYFTTRHRNEQRFVIFEVLRCLDHYNLSAFDKDHWSVMDDFLKFLNVQHELNSHAALFTRIFTAFTYFNLTHDLPIDENIEMLVELKMESYREKWCIFEKYLEYDRLCFGKMMSLIPYKYPSHHKIWNTTSSIMSSIARSMDDLNERNANRSNNTKLEKLSMKNYPWMLKAIKDSLEGADKEKILRFDTLIKYLKKWEVDLYEEWILGAFNCTEDVTTVEALKALKEEPSKILDNCDKYWEAIIEKVQSTKITQRFVKASRWHQDIPIRFSTLCLNSLSGDKAADSLMVLAILKQGSEFAEIIKPLVPKDEKKIVAGDNAKSRYLVLRTIPRAMNLANPPVPLALVNSFCDGDYLKLGLTALTNVSRRSSVERVEKFAKQLADNRVSVKKHGIRLFCLVATIADYRDFLVSLWKTEKHRSIRLVILQNIYRLFLDNPSQEHWIMMKDCLADLNVRDDDILYLIEDFNDVPDAYIAGYTSYLLEIFDKLEADGFDSERMAVRVAHYLRNITPSVSRLLTDEFLEKLMKKYLCSSTVAPEVAKAAMHYTFYIYLRGDPTKFNSRLITFSNVYVDILREQWNKLDSEELASSPINHVINKFVEQYVFSDRCNENNVKMMESILKSFLLVLKPQQDWTTYALLTFGIALNTGVPSLVAENIAKALTHFVETFSSVMVIELAGILNKLIHLNCDYDEFNDELYKVVEILCNIATSDSCTLAAKLLSYRNGGRTDNRPKTIIENLIKCPHTVAVSLAYQLIKKL